MLAETEGALASAGRVKVSVGGFELTFAKYFCAIGFAVCNGLTLTSTESFFGLKGAFGAAVVAVAFAPTGSFCLEGLVAVVGGTFDEVSGALDTAVVFPLKQLSQIFCFWVLLI